MFSIHPAELFQLFHVLFSGNFQRFSVFCFYGYRSSRVSLCVGVGCVSGEDFRTINHKILNVLFWHFQFFSYMREKVCFFFFLFLYLSQICSLKELQSTETSQIDAPCFPPLDLVIAVVRNDKHFDGD